MSPIFTRHGSKLLNPSVPMLSSGTDMPLGLGVALAQTEGFAILLGVTKDAYHLGHLSHVQVDRWMLRDVRGRRTIAIIGCRILFPHHCAELTKVVAYATEIT